MGQVVSEQSKGNGKAEIYLQAGCSSRFGEQPGFLVAIVYKVHHQAYAVQYIGGGQKVSAKIGPFVWNGENNDRTSPR